MERDLNNTVVTVGANNTNIPDPRYKCNPPLLFVPPPFNKLNTTKSLQIIQPTTKYYQLLTMPATATIMYPAGPSLDLDCL